MILCNVAETYYKENRDKFHFNYEIIDWDEVTSHLLPIDMDKFFAELARSGDVYKRQGTGYHDPDFCMDSEIHDRQPGSCRVRSCSDQRKRIRYCKSASGYYLCSWMPAGICNRNFLGNLRNPDPDRCRRCLLYTSRCGIIFQMQRLTPMMMQCV